ncbi:MAG TPA: SCO family protein [Tepidisphaeraceae bacterium]
MKTKNERLINNISLAAAVALIIGLSWLVLRGRGAREEAEEPLPVLWDVPAFAFPNQNNQVITPADLKGQVWIADFIFTRCTTACPVLTARMVLLQRALAGRGVKFVSFTVDPEHDSPQVLKEYAGRWQADESRWNLLHTIDSSTLQSTVAALKVGVEKGDNPLHPILHTSRFMLTDSAGKVRGLYDSTDEQAMKNLVRDAITLSTAISAPKAAEATNAVGNEAAAGRELFASVGCMACHAKENIAPNLDGLIGREVKLADGRTIKADEAYVRESIVNPSVKVAAGYPQAMPAYAGHLTPEQVTALVSYIASTQAPESAAAEREMHVDPVCEMDVSADAETPKAMHEGKTYYFCADVCRKRFEKDPVKFLAKAAEAE